MGVLLSQSWAELDREFSVVELKWLLVSPMSWPWESQPTSLSPQKPVQMSSFTKRPQHAENRQDFSHCNANVKSLLDEVLRRGSGEREA
jgi:hypothetical protein